MGLFIVRMWMNINTNDDMECVLLFHWSMKKISYSSFFVCHRCYNHRKKREKKKLYHQETNHSPRTYKKGTEQLKSIWILVYQCITRTSFNFDHVRTTTTHISFILFFFLFSEYIKIKKKIKSNHQVVTHRWTLAKGSGETFVLRFLI